MVSLTISISSEGLSASLHPTPSASICSSRSHCSAPPPYQKHHPYRYGFKARTSRKGSFESLLPRSKKERKGEMVGSGNATSERKGSETLPITIEMRKSFGRGGAGNIRRPSDVPYAARSNENGTHRRSSVWSTISISPGSSLDGRRATLMSLFGRKNCVGDAEERVKFKNVDLSGNKTIV